MSQKIDGGIAPAAHLRTIAASSKVGAGSESRAQMVEAADSLRLTGEATGLQAIQRELSAAPAVDAARVAQVREALQNGSYRINPEAIADRMIALDQQIFE